VIQFVQAEQSWLELGLRLSRGLRGANDLLGVAQAGYNVSQIARGLMLPYGSAHKLVRLG
jgi:hypothetical protein